MPESFRLQRDSRLFDGSRCPLAQDDCMPCRSQAAPAGPLESAHAMLHQRAGACRRRGAVPGVWIFILDAGKRERTRWYWSHGSVQGERSDRGFASFDECVADARGRGFDFAQPYHVTATS